MEGHSVQSRAYASTYFENTVYQVLVSDVRRLHVEAPLPKTRMSSNVSPSTCMQCRVGARSFFDAVNPARQNAHLIGKIRHHLSPTVAVGTVFTAPFSCWRLLMKCCVPCSRVHVAR
ncbi:hypothetical protein M441DRAFT_263830 [Trichoderma asperellum CBS 433.97]|uniref:Uncharacterized protein n=1 Tax=Trichoderma asperellum (strain ATCC 204424 / CBS 433.97 / NBRC 101777) TaxID=1042311 RepID=A0A2T3YXI5_TRIA4|nr:hypothetical protein M441DRAFT_263830 [Trichoderma asperellum CBS 433.97]PTB37234.1 hypothetical protein M441DRAFT_263830 [Trichoderma asperellum CBS 433.97]